MSIDAAKVWHDAAMARIKAIELWIKVGKPLPYGTTGDGQEYARELNKSLLPLLQDYQSLKQKAALVRLGTERDDVRKLRSCVYFLVSKPSFNRHSQNA